MSWMRRTTRRLKAIGQVLRTIIGVPNYEQYCVHMRERHPDQVPLSQEEFLRQRLEERYEKPGARCC